MSYLLDYNPGTQQWGYPRRGANLSGTCIIHTAECAMDLDGDDQSAETCANFIANRADYGSYHRLVDSDSIIDMVPFEYEAWQDSETNPWAVGISAAVQAGRWLEIPAARRDRIYRNMASAAAEFVNHMAGKGITVPLVRISGAQARARVPGFCAHGDSGISRTDPGTQFDWALFFNYTARALGDSLSYASETITPKEWYEMALDAQVKTDIFDAVWGSPGTPLIFNNELQREEYPRTTLGAMTDRIIRQHIAPMRQELAALAAVTQNLVKALANVSGGEALDQDKLLAGIKATVIEATKIGFQASIESVEETTTVNLK
jgi:hypothetical protein